MARHSCLAAQHRRSRLARKARLAVQLLALAPSLLGCALRDTNRAGVMVVAGDGRQGEPVSRFPSKGEVLEGRLEPEQLERETTGLPRGSIDGWEVATEGRDATSAAPARRLAEELLGARLAGSAVRPSPALCCAAKNAARLFVEHQVFPNGPMLEFIAARCGGSGTRLSLGGSWGTVTAASQIDAASRASVEQLLAQAQKQHPDALGLGGYERNGRVAFALVTESSSIWLDEPRKDDAPGSATLSGRAPADTAYVEALVTRGRYAVRPCERDRSITLPRFSVTCPLDEEYPSAIEVAVRRAHDVLWRVGFRRELGGGPSGARWSAPRAEVATSKESFASELARVINQVRSSANHPPLELLTAQSWFSDTLAPTLYFASLAGNSSTLERTALGLLAGWDVPGMIRDGSVFWAAFDHALSPESWCAEAMRSPFGRRALMRHTATQLAIGSHREQDRQLSVVTSYELFGQSTAEQDEQIVRRELGALRRSRGLAEPRAVKRGPVLTQALEQIAKNELSVSDAMFEVTSRLNAGERTTVFAVESNSLYFFPIPEQLFAGSYELELGVTHYRPKGAAWGQFVIAFILHYGPSGTTSPTAAK